MEKLIIENKTDLLALKEMLEFIPLYLEEYNVKLSAVSNQVGTKIIKKIEEILE